MNVLTTIILTTLSLFWQLIHLNDSMGEHFGNMEGTTDSFNKLENGIRCSFINILLSDLKDVLEVYWPTLWRIKTSLLQFYTGWVKQKDRI